MIKTKLTKVNTVEKPWGKEIWLAVEREYAGKILEIRKGTRTSLHYHEKKKETMYVLDGELKVISPSGEIIIKKGSSITINPREVHRLVPLKDLRIIEVSTPQLEDVKRTENDYGRG